MAEADDATNTERVPGDVKPANASAVSPEQLQTHANATQQDVIEQLERAGPVTVENEFWITNAIVITVDTDQLPIERIAAIDQVTEIHTDFEVELEAAASLSGQGGTSDTSHANTGPSIETDAESTADASWNVDRVNAPEAWSAYDTKGEDVKVAVLDTGIEAEHDDLDLYTTDPTDPTYPGGWAEIDGTGTVVDDPGEPIDEHGHGTRVSGLVAGGDEIGEFVGVAPNIDLMHARIAGSDGSSSFTRMVGGLEWAVENDATVASLSFGADGYYSSFIEPIRNAERSGTVVVASIGNSGEGTSSTPGNEYDTIGVGATDNWDDVSSFSGGEVIDTDEAWGGSAPDDWPAEYTVPRVVAPGSNVLTTDLDNSHRGSSGTSVAAPHVAGGIGLMQAATTVDHSPDELRAALEETAVHPDGDDAQDIRYGYGIIDVFAAIEYLEETDGAPEFEITDAALQTNTVLEGESVDATATVENVGTASGEFTLELQVTDEDGVTTTLDSETVALEPEEVSTVSLDGPVSDAGEYEVDIDGVDVGTLTVESPAQFELVDGSVSAETITTGESVTVSATVQNVGDRAGTFTAELLVENVETDDEFFAAETHDISLEGGESETVSFEYEPDAEGEYNLVVAGDAGDGDRTETSAGQLTVNSPANLIVTDTALGTETVLEDETVAITGTVENTGGTVGERVVALEVDENVVNSTTVTVDADDSETVVFQEEFSDAGAYDISINETHVGTLTVERPAIFEADNAWLSDDVVLEGDAVEVSATVENVGDRTGTFTAELVVDGDVTETAAIELEAGETDVVTFVYEPSQAGEYTVEVIGDDNAGATLTLDAGTLLVERPATFDLTNAVLDETTILEEEFASVVADVTNEGDREGTYEVALLVDDDVTQTKELTVGAGETKQFTFTESFAEAGEYDISVNGLDAGTLTVEEPAVFEPGDGWLSDDVVLEDAVVDVIAEIENVGDRTGTFTAELVVDGESEQATAIELAGDESDVVTFEYEAETAGEYDFVIVGEDDTGTLFEIDVGTLLVERPATFDLSDVRIDQTEIIEGESVDVTAEILNEGDRDGTYEVSLFVDDTTVQTTNVTVEAGETSQALFTETFDEAGSYDIAVNGLEAGTLLVEEREDDSGDDSEDGDDSGVDVTGDGNVATDTTGDGLLNDVTGDGTFTRADVETLANNLDNDVVQDNAEKFDFAGMDSTEVTSHDVQALFMEQRSAEPATFELTAVTLSEAEIETGDSVEVSATIENVGDEIGTFEAELQIDGETVDTESLEIAGSDEETVTFTETFDEAGSYDIAVSELDAGTLLVEERDDDSGDDSEDGDDSGVDVTGDGNVATDTTGDGLLNDVTGDGTFTRADVETLANNLDNDVVQDNAEKFDFAGMDSTEVTSHDVQALYMQLRS